MTSVVLALPLAEGRRLAAGAAHHGHRVLAVCATSAEVLRALASGPPDLLVVAADPVTLDPAVVSAADAAGVRVVVVAGDQRLARSLGLLEIVEGPVDWPDLIGPAADTGPPVPAVRPPGRVVVVWGPAGAPGRTTLAIAIAAQLAEVGHAVVLADADTHAASVAPALGLLDEAPGFAAACRLAGSGGLDHVELERVAQTCRARRGAFRVLTGLGRPGRWPELSAARVTATLRATRGWADWTVVDVAASLERDEELSSDLAGPRRNAATLAALEEADTIVAVGAADPIGVARFLRGVAELAETVDAERITPVANRVRAGVAGLDPGRQVRQTLRRFGGLDRVHLIPDEPTAFDAALLLGRPLGDAAPHGPARAAVRELVAAFAADDGG